MGALWVNFCVNSGVILAKKTLAAVVERRVGLSALEPGTREREDIRDVAKRIRHREDAALGGDQLVVRRRPNDQDVRLHQPGLALLS